MVRAINRLEEGDLPKQPVQEGRSPERTLKSFRYLVHSVNQNALSVWADLWKEMQGSVGASGQVMPGMQEGFQPACGWPEFLEKFWLLKHYLDCVHRFSKTPPD